MVSISWAEYVLFMVKELITCEDRFGNWNAKRFKFVNNNLPQQNKMENGQNNCTGIKLTYICRLRQVHFIWQWMVLLALHLYSRLDIAVIWVVQFQWVDFSGASVHCTKSLFSHIRYRTQELWSTKSVDATQFWIMWQSASCLGCE